jgi:hypothetical protein
VAPKGMIIIFPLYEGQQQGGSGLVWKSCNGMAEDPQVAVGSLAGVGSKATY